MLAVTQKVEEGYIARYDRHLQYSVEKVWSVLTENAELAKWFPELSVDVLREGGAIQFNFPDGTYEELRITELKMQSVLEYTWWGDRVRFELYSDPEGCRLVLKRLIQAITGHTAKDLAGWHVCLDVIEALLNGKTVESREELWKPLYEQYTKVCQSILG